MINICICSYNRFNLIKQKTLHFLNKHSLNALNKVYIITPQIDEYKESLKDYDVNFIKCNIGLSNARIAVNQSFPLDSKIWFLDDDIDDILTMNENIIIQNEIEKIFKIMHDQKIFLASINPTSNKYYSKGLIKVGLYFCIGACYFIINEQRISFNKDELEDYQRSIEYFKRDKKVLRNDRLFIKTKYNQKGGMHTETRNENRSRRAIELFLEYPEYILLKKKKNYLGLILKKNTKNRLVELNMGGGLNQRAFLNGLYPTISLDIKLDLNTNYIFKLDNKIIGYLIRNLYYLGDFKFKMKENQNSGDIAGRVTKQKIQKNVLKYFHELEFNKSITRTKKTDKHKFEMSNTIKRVSGLISLNDKIQNIYNDIKSYNVLNESNYYSVNKELQSAYHLDRRNKSPYVMLITKNNNLDLHLPQLELEINNRDGDILVFDLKKYFHGNTEGDLKNRYSIIFFDK